MNASRVVIRNIVLSGRRKRNRLCREYPGVCRAIRIAFGEKYELLDKLVCPYCLKQFRYQASLSHHIRRKHFAELMDDVEKAVTLIKQRRC
jgi:uncharacterized C2H2 Zn-finger protein